MRSAYPHQPRLTTPFIEHWQIGAGADLGAAPMVCGVRRGTEWSDHNIPKTGPGNGDSRLTPEGRAALLALVENDDFGKYLDDVCSDEAARAHALPRTQVSSDGGCAP